MIQIPPGVDSCDQKVFSLLHPYSAKVRMANWMRVVSISASGFFCFPVYGAVYFLAHQHILVSRIIAGECIQLPIIIILRLTVRRPRPVDSGRYLSKWNSYSFPSLHSSRAFMLGLIIYSLHNWTLVIVLAAVLLIAFSRLILQKHYLSDIICGAATGLFSSAASLYLLPETLSLKSVPLFGI